MRLLLADRDVGRFKLVALPTACEELLALLVDKLLRNNVCPWFAASSASWAPVMLTYCPFTRDGSTPVKTRLKSLKILFLMAAVGVVPLVAVVNLAAPSVAALNCPKPALVKLTLGKAIKLPVWWLFILVGVIMPAKFVCCTVPGAMLAGDTDTVMEGVTGKAPFPLATATRWLLELVLLPLRFLLPGFVMGAEDRTGEGKAEGLREVKLSRDLTGQFTAKLEDATDETVTGATHSVEKEDVDNVNGVAIVPDDKLSDGGSGTEDVTGDMGSFDLGLVVVFVALTRLLLRVNVAPLLVSTMLNSYGS